MARLSFNDSRIFETTIPRPLIGSEKRPRNFIFTGVDSDDTLTNKVETPLSGSIGTKSRLDARYTGRRKFEKRQSNFRNYLYATYGKNVKLSIEIYVRRVYLYAKCTSRTIHCNTPSPPIRHFFKLFIVRNLLSTI